MPFLPPNQQRQSIEGKIHTEQKQKKMALMYLMMASKSRQYDAVKTSKQI